MYIANKLLTCLAVGIVVTLALPGCASDTESSDEETADGDTIVVAQGPDEPGDEARESEPTAAPGGGLSPQAVAPSCIQRTLVHSRLLHLSSSCDSAQWVKVILRHHSDSNCFKISPGQITTVQWNWPGTFDGVQSC